MVTLPTTGYLILARYNHLKREKLLENDKLTNKQEHAQARQAAEKLFPYERGSVKPLPLPNIIQVHTFRSKFASLLPEDYRSRPIDEKLAIATEVINKLGPDNLGVGWMAQVDAENFPWFVDQMSGQGTGSGLWQIFDVEVFPLSETRTITSIQIPGLDDDKTTADIYDLMTPTSWNH